MDEDHWVSPGQRFARNYRNMIVAYVLGIFVIGIMGIGLTVGSDRDARLIREAKAKDTARAVRAQAWEDTCHNEWHGVILRSAPRVCIQKDAVLGIEE